VAATVLAVVAAALLLVSVVLVLVGALDGSTSAAGAWPRAAGAVLTCALGATGLIGAVSLHRGAGRTLLLGTALVQLGTVAAATVWAGVQLAWGSGTQPPVTSGVLVGALAAVALTGAQVRLASARSVGRWLESTARARASAPAGADRAPTARPAALAVGTPVAVLALVTAVVVVGAGPEVTRIGPVTPVVPAEEAHSPVGPPSPADDDWSAEFDPGAQACHAGSMTACDDLFWESSVGDVYESYGSTCGGRLARATDGGCRTALGAALN
jgi:hypothetical protein